MKKRISALLFIGVLVFTMAKTYGYVSKPKSATCEGWWGDCRITVGDVTIEGDGTPVVVFE